jgi:heme exporter protein A
MIQLARLEKNYGLQPVLRGVDLHVERGEFLTLLGPNGAGKTTLLRIIATLSRPTAGEIRVGGWPLPRSADRVRPHLGLISHHPLLYNELTAVENLTFFARMYRLPSPNGRIAEVLQAVDLSARRDDPVGEYSRGMQQRLAIARAILHQPDILLLDEPYTGLDQSASTMLDGLLSSVATAGRTVVMTTHNLTRGFANCDRVAILSRGKIAFHARREELGAEELMRIYHDLTGGKSV